MVRSKELFMAPVPFKIEPLSTKPWISFETVFHTKVTGLNVLLEATQQDPLKYLVLFSSITARIGNNGQADYAMANEVLNKIAQQESHHTTGLQGHRHQLGPLGWGNGMLGLETKI